MVGHDSYKVDTIVQFYPGPLIMKKDLTKEEKLKELHKKRDETIEKLNGLYKNFRGVIHEDSASEMKYTQIRVLESFIESLNAEIKSLEGNQSSSK